MTPVLTRCFSLFALVFLVSPQAQGETQKQDPAIRHVVVYHEKGRFGGWPANHGIWVWGNEILCGFSAAHYKDYEGSTHAVDRKKPEHHLFARSLDGGETWAITDPSEKGVIIPRGAMLMGSPLPGKRIPPLRQLDEAIDFTHPDLALTFRMEDYRGGGQSRFYFSYDRGNDWNGPFALPLFDTPGIGARTDYIVNGQHELMAFLSAGKSDGKTGRTLCAQTKDGGLSWEFVAWIGPEPEGYHIMPSTVRLNDQELLTVIRVSGQPLAAYHSPDNGKTWNLRSDTVAATGPVRSRTNPPSLVKLQDGRLAVVYGYRAKPYGIRASFSSDDGRSWGGEISLRKDGVSWDLGYPRTVQRPDGKMVSVYYFHDAAHRPEPYIAATIWDPTHLSAGTTSTE